MNKLVVYNHGKDSEPWGEKALALQAVAVDLGYEFISLDYRPSNDPESRVQQLLANDFSGYQQIVLVGSSMGGYVATVAAETLPVQGLFLIAPAFYLPGYARTEFNPLTTNIAVFHGWQDDIVPAQNAWRFCQAHRARLCLFDADHRLLSILPQMADAFKGFLADLSR